MVIITYYPYKTSRMQYGLLVINTEVHGMQFSGEGEGDEERERKYEIGPLAVH
jgi:hypothetical protein